VDARLPGSYLLELVQLAERFGARQDDVLEGLVAPGALLDPSTRLDLETAARILERARTLSGEPGLAMTMGLQLRASAHGFLGFAAITANTLRDALDLAMRFGATRTAAIEVSSYVEAGTASVVVEERVSFPDAALRELVIFTTLFAIAEVALAVTGRTLEGSAEVRFAEPDYFMRFADWARGRVRFSRPVNRLVFPEWILDLPVLSADPVATALAQQQCERELALLTHHGGILGRVRAALDEASGARSLEEVARRVSMSPRTLKRRLSELGVTFSSLQDEVRRARALLLLESAELSMVEVAERLGYSDPANFTRAFRRWTGTTPGAFRGR
jgi:AraC-like DNA-binding protein